MSGFPSHDVRGEKEILEVVQIHGWTGLIRCPWKTLLALEQKLAQRDPITPSRLPDLPNAAAGSTPGNTPAGPVSA